MQDLPPEFVEQFHEQFDCWNRGQLDKMLDGYAEDAVFDVSHVFTDVEPIQGSEAIRRYWGTLRETWDGLRIDPLRGYDLGNNLVVLEQRMWATGTKSKIEVDQRFAVLYTFRPQDRRAARAVLYPDLETAIAAGESQLAQTA